MSLPGVVDAIPVASVIEVQVQLVVRQSQRDGCPTMVSPRVDVKTDVQQVLCAHELQLDVLVAHSRYAPPSAPDPVKTNSLERIAYGYAYV